MCLGRIVNYMAGTNKTGPNEVALMENMKINYKID